MHVILIISIAGVQLDLTMWLFVAAGITYLIYTISSSFRYYVKFTFLTLAALICASIYIPIMIWRPMDSRNALLPSWSLKQIGEHVMGLKFIVRGQENIVQNSGCVVVINHQSILDLLVMSTLWPYIPNGATIAKKEIFYMWPFGLATWLWGTIFIDRLNSERAKSTINKTAAKVKTEQVRLCMFPEGTRHGGDTLLPFKKGAFHVAIESQCPIQPIIVSRYDFIDHKNRTFNQGTSIISILPAVPTTGLKKDDVNKLIDDIYEIMNKNFIELSKDVSSKRIQVN